LDLLSKKAQIFLSKEEVKLFSMGGASTGWECAFWVIFNTAGRPAAPLVVACRTSSKDAFARTCWPTNKSGARSEFPVAPHRQTLRGTRKIQFRPLQWPRRLTSAPGTLPCSKFQKLR
jgi:hypothetical protein